MGLAIVTIKQIINHMSIKELHSRTANNASKIISALCELNKLDITQPYGDSNKGNHGCT